MAQKIYDAADATTGSTFSFPRTFRSTGSIEVEFVPDGGGPSTFTAVLEARVDPSAPWVTILTIEESDTGGTGSDLADISDVTIYNEMRLRVTAVGNVADQVRAWIAE